MRPNWSKLASLLFLCLSETGSDTVNRVLPSSRLDGVTSRKHTYIILTPSNPTFI